MPQVPVTYHLSTGAQCREMDQKTISEFGIPSFTLMEIAGTRAADFILSKTQAGSHALIVCGRGNNAGDALVVARLLLLNYYSVTVCFVDGRKNLTSDTQKNLELLQKLNGEIHFLNLNELAHRPFDFIIDGMLGTGLNSELRAPYTDAVAWVNAQKVPVFALDVPTGLHADSGKVLGSAIRAHYTLTFGSRKIGFYLNQGPEYSGEIVLCRLPIPQCYYTGNTFLISREWVEGNAPITPKRRKHKYDGGLIYIIAGAEGLTGAAVLTAKSAWSGGAGAVTLISPRGLLNIYEKHLIQIIKKPVGAADDTSFKTAHLAEVKRVLSEKPGKLIIGPGLGRNEETQTFVQQLLNEFEGDAVVDADALFALAARHKVKKPAASRWILTPHAGELKTLLGGLDISDDYDRLNAVTHLAKDDNVTLLAKGYPAITGTESGSCYLTAYDTRIFARAGFGDVLAGKIAAFWLMETKPEMACFLALLHGYDNTHRAMETSPSPQPLDII